MTFYPGPIQSPGGTYTGAMGEPRFPNSTAAIRDGVTFETGTASPRGTIGASSGVQCSGTPGAAVGADVRLTSVTSGTTSTTWFQDVQARVISIGPPPYEPTTEFAATGPEVVGWTWPGSGVMHLDGPRCLAIGGSVYSDYTAWVSTGLPAYNLYWNTHYEPATSAPLNLNAAVTSRNFANAPIALPPFAASWVVGVPSSYATGPVAGSSGHTALCLTSLGASLGSSSTYTSVIGNTAVPRELTDWPTTSYPGIGPVYLFGWRFTAHPVSAADMLAYGDRNSAAVGLTWPSLTGTAPKTPWQWLTTTPVEPPSGVGVLKTKVSMSASSEAGRWESWGFDNEGAGAGKILASDGWHVADDDAATTTGLLKVLDADGVWQPVSWMTGD